MKEIVAPFARERKGTSSNPRASSIDRCPVNLPAPACHALACTGYRQVMSQSRKEGTRKKLKYEKSRVLAYEIAFTGKSRVHPDCVYGLEVATTNSSPLERRSRSLVGFALMPYPDLDPGGQIGIGDWIHLANLVQTTLDHLVNLMIFAFMRCFVKYD
jgi:hypothetical protein